MTSTARNHDLLAGNQALARGDYAEALACYRVVCEQNPRLARVLAANISLAEARCAAETAVEEAPVARELETWDAARERELRETLGPAPSLGVAAADAPLASVVLATYDRADVLPMAIASVLLQSFEHFELLVVDDGSTDHTEALVRQCFGDPRIRYLRTAHNGVSAARNVGLAEARGRFVFFLDSDNTWTPSFLALMLTFMLKTGVQAAYSGLEALDDLGQTRYYRGEDFRWQACSDANYIDLNSFGFDRGELPHLKFNEALQRWVDWDLILRCGFETGIGFVPFLGVRYYDGDRRRITNSVWTDDEVVERTVAQMRGQFAGRERQVDDRDYRFEVLRQRLMAEG